MLKHLLLIPIAALISLTASAQFRYTFKDTTTPYTPITGATSVNGSTIWDDEDFTIPLPFTFKMDSSISLTSLELILSEGVLIDQATNPSNINGFMYGEMDLVDRGSFTNINSLSPISYVTTGSAPNRIFKLEIKNAGFYEENASYNTMDDSVDMQIWIYETKNIVEFHYGPSKITYPGDYFPFGGNGPFISYLKNIDSQNGTTGKMYYLKNSGTSIIIDTLDFPTITIPPAGLNAWPANGKVFRFTPKTTCTVPAANFTSSAPAGKTVTYTYNGTTTGLDSLVWNFGDGQKQKVITGYTTPIAHTFVNNGKYTVTATAYSSCGNNTFTRQLALAVGNLSVLGNVKVYPNPAGNFITIDGMKAGDKAAILSLAGQEVLSTTISSSTQQIDISSLAAGTYLLVASDATGAKGALKIVKQ